MRAVNAEIRKIRKITRPERPVRVTRQLMALPAIASTAGCLLGVGASILGAGALGSLAICIAAGVGCGIGGAMFAEDATRRAEAVAWAGGNEVLVGASGGHYYILPSGRKVYKSARS
jgi:hypothetical protein